MIKRLQKKCKNSIIVPSISSGKHSNRPYKYTEEENEEIIDHLKSFPAESSHYSRNSNINKVSVT